MTDYDLMCRQLESLSEGVSWDITVLSNAAALIWDSLEDINWAGFYLMKEGKLLLGPFQGKPACTVIEIGKGVCGTAAAEDKTQLVKNVHEFPGHIACDSASNSEIVVPLHSKGRNEMFISEVMTTAPQDERGALETKTYQELERLNIKYERVDNDSVEAMEECVEISEKLGAEIRKTIVVCNRQKTQFFLVLLPANKRFDSKLFAAMMRTARVSFASPEDMQNVIGLTPGEASVMGILNDPEGKVKVVIDKAVADAEWFACNPGANTSHLKFKTKQLINNFLPAEKHKPEIIML